MIGIKPTMLLITKEEDVAGVAELPVKFPAAAPLENDEEAAIPKENSDRVAVKQGGN